MHGDHYKLIVRREEGLLVLRVFKNNKWTGETVKARDAQTLIDYVAEHWPAGTIVQWVVLPPLPIHSLTCLTSMVRAESDGREATGGLRNSARHSSARAFAKATARKRIPFIPSL